MTTAPRSEFIVAEAYRYNHKNAFRWLVSHIWALTGGWR